jgi:virulence-associated protein VapD
MTKVFIGLSDIASFIDDWNYGFKENGFKTIKGSLYYQTAIQNSHLDFIIQKKLDKVGYFKPGRISEKFKPWWDKKVRSYYLKKMMAQCDVFVFIWNSFSADFSDYEILKNNGKKIITVFVGDEVRWEPAMKQEFINANLPVFEYKDYDYSINSLNSRLKLLRTAEKYSDIILSQPNIMQLALRNYHNLHIPIVSDDYIEIKEQRLTPIIIHAPTSIGKGTKEIELVIERLKNEGFDFIYQCVQNVPREQALSMYKNADMIIDQIQLPGGGKLAQECLAMGKVVLTHMAYQSYNQKKPIDSPIIDVTAKNLYNELIKLIPDLELRTLIAAKGRAYVQKYHDPKKIVNEVLNMLKENKGNSHSEFKPTFFRETFIPESSIALMEYNKWNQYVSDCDWYKKSVMHGERAGLLF